MKLYKKMTDTWETRTNQEGNAMLPPIPQGTLRIQVIASQLPDIRPDHGCGCG